MQVKAFSQNVAASPIPVQIEQHDGSKLSIVGKGTEYISYTETEDGYTLVLNKNDIYEYAKSGSDGDLIASGVQAHDKAKRKRAERKFVCKSSKNLRYQGKKLEELIAKIKTETSNTK